MKTACSMVLASGLLFSAAASALPNADDALFQACVREKGATYITAVSNYCSSASGTNMLVKMAGNSSAPVETRLQAHILLARLENSKAFDEFKEVFQKLRDRPEAKCRRVGYLSGQILSFTRLGHESRMSWERSGERHVGIMKAPRFEKVEKYTQRDVDLGATRNRAVRMAAVELLLKFSCTLSSYESIEFMSVLGGIKDYYEHQADTSYSGLIQDLILNIINDDKWPLPVRVDAVYKLSPDRWNRQFVTELMFKALQEYKSEDALEHQGTVYAACDFMKHFGNHEDLKILRGISLKNSEAQKLLDETIVEMGVRLGKK